VADAVKTFVEEFRRFQYSLKANDTIELGLKNLKYKYNLQNDKSTISGEGYNLDLEDASSGIQSYIPLFIISKFLSDETSMIRLTQTRRKIHYASSIRPIKNKLFTDEITLQKDLKSIRKTGNFDK
jgi:hypothetical protein